MNLDLNHSLRETLELLADGKHYVDIALLCNISIEGVKSRAKRLMDALDAETLEHAIAIAFRHGLLQLYSATPKASQREEIAATAHRRRDQDMCVPCRTGQHRVCGDGLCPCVCKEILRPIVMPEAELEPVSA